jgi:hypothetical protein
MKTPSTNDPRPDRKNLGPTGPAKVESGRKPEFDETHPNAGNVADGKGHIGPTPTDDPKGKARKLRPEIDQG